MDPTSEQIKTWLALVANARVAIGIVASHSVATPVGDAWELEQAANYLENAYLNGLDAHGQALLREAAADDQRKQQSA